jgi:DNA replication protein
MLTESTVTKLREMRMSVMASALKDQLSDPQYRNMEFEDRVGLLVDAEWNARKSNHLRRLIRQATFSDPSACLENVEYLPDRNLKQEELLRLGSCNYVHERHNVILLGATGSGKTYLACALGMAAVRQFLPVKYIRLPDLLVDFSIARGNGTIRKLMTQYKKYSLLIIDEWLLYPLKESECRDLLEIMESRYKRASTVLCSQFDIPGWRDKLGDPILADAICDRIVHDSYTIIIGGQESMRKRKGLKDT